MIVTLRLRPGSVVTESELVRLTGIGRTPVRQAIQRLELQGLVATLPRRGIHIKDMNITEFFAILDVRRALDRVIALRAAKRATKEQRAALRACAAGVKKAAAQQSLSDFMHVDHDFDQILESAAHNPYAVQAAAPLHIHCRRLWFTYQHAGDLARAAAAHSKLMLAVAAGDASATAKASDELVDYLVGFVKGTIQL